MQPGQHTMLPLQNNTLITVQSGCTLAKLAQITLKNSLTGMEALAGIPGTIGGAIKMNAGAYGTEIKDILTSTTYIDTEGNVETINLTEHNFKYRSSFFSDKDYIILETTINLKEGNANDIKQKMDEYSESRKEKQPIELPNAGSTFKRLENKFTALLIEEADLKGYSIGDAMVSTKHSGFIVNTKNATAKDVLMLVEHIKKEIKNKFNENIELEIIVVGE